MGFTEIGRNMIGTFLPDERKTFPECDAHISDIYAVKYPE